MKHENESIDRLDGDVYENINGDIIIMSKVTAIKTPRAWDGVGWYPNYEIVTIGGFLKVYMHDRCFEDFKWSNENYDKDDNNLILIKKLEFTTEKYRQQFIEVWKHWKSINKT